MTEKPIELTEDDIEIFERGTIAFPKKYDTASITAFGLQTTASSEYTKEDAELLRKQILQALQELPKLQKDIESFKQLNFNLFKKCEESRLENQKLKAENEELKLKYEKLKSDFNVLTITPLEEIERHNGEFVKRISDLQQKATQGQQEISTLRHQKEELLETNRDLAKENARLLDILNFYRIKHD